MAFDDPEWVRSLKQGGAVPLMDVSSCFNGWSSPPGHYFQVRGEEYLRSKAKVAGGEWLLKPLAFDWVKSSTSKISYIMSHPNCRVRGALEALGRADPRGKPFIWVFNLQVPSKDNHSLVFYFLSYKNDSAMKERLVDRFLHADAEFRDSRLKLVANVEKGPWIVKKAVGEQAVCILGKAVSCEYFQGEDFMEIDVDIGGSVIANAVVNLAFGYVTSLSVDLAFVIEGRTESELPEKILGAIRFSNLDPELAISMEEAVIKHDKLDGLIGVHELETRFWRSLLHVESEEADDHHLQRRILSVADC